MHVRYNSWYISFPSSAKQQREITKFCVVWRTLTTTDNFVNLYLEFCAVFHIQFRDRFDKEKQTLEYHEICRLIINSFFNLRCPQRRRYDGDLKNEFLF